MNQTIHEFDEFGCTNGPDCEQCKQLDIEILRWEQRHPTRTKLFNALKIIVPAVGVTFTFLCMAGMYIYVTWLLTSKTLQILRGLF